MRFAASVPQNYQRYMVPLFFEPYAADLAARVAQRQPSRVLEVAAGTGVVTRRLAEALPPEVPIVATDLNPPMLEAAAAIGTARPVEWRQADALELPFEDESFDLIVCQFGAMFFPDKPRAFAEARRVLRPGGAFLLSVWDRLDQNDFPATVMEALEELYPEAPPRFMERIPHGYHDPEAVARDLAKGGFAGLPEVVLLTLRSRADSPRIPALAICQGTPMCDEIEARDPGGLEKATDHAAQALARRYGPGPIEGKIQAYVVTVER